MTNIRKCKMCGKEVDFSEPWCAHETMEESAWLNMPVKETKSDITRESSCTKTRRQLRRIDT